MNRTKIFLGVVGVLLQLPWLGWWMISRSDHSGSHGPGSMGLVMPAILCGALWLLGGVLNVVLLIVEMIAQSKPEQGGARLATPLGISTLIWAILTMGFLVTRSGRFFENENDSAPLHLDYPAADDAGDAAPSR